MRSRSAADDHGGVSVEFAVALPVVVLVLGACLGAIGLGAQQVRLQDAAADAARGLGRGDAAAVVAEGAQRSAPGARVSSTTSGGLVCVRVTAPARAPVPLGGWTLAARACALAGGG